MLARVVDHQRAAGDEHFADLGIVGEVDALVAQGRVVACGHHRSGAVAVDQHNRATLDGEASRQPLHHVKDELLRITARGQRGGDFDQRGEIFALPLQLFAEQGDLIHCFGAGSQLWTLSRPPDAGTVTQRASAREMPRWPPRALP